MRTGTEAFRPLIVRRLISVLGWPGDDLLSHVLRQSTIGAKAFDGRVRDGIGSDRLARATRPAKNGFSDRAGDQGSEGTEIIDRRSRPLRRSKTGIRQTAIRERRSEGRPFPIAVY